MKVKNGLLCCTKKVSCNVQVSRPPGRPSESTMRPLCHINPSQQWRAARDVNAARDGRAARGTPGRVRGHRSGRAGGHVTQIISDDWRGFLKDPCSRSEEFSQALQQLPVIIRYCSTFGKSF